MPKLVFDGLLNSSKSLMNRALIVQSFFPQLKVSGFSESEDVHAMKSSLASAPKFQNLNAASAGTTLRFLVPRVSREKGRFEVHGSERLFQRPQQDLIPVMRALGVELEFKESSIVIYSEGWAKPTSEVLVSQTVSSQFLSGVLLSAWGLTFDLVLQRQGSKDTIKSESYLRMTLGLLRKLGMDIVEEGISLTVPAGQKLKVLEYSVEADMSSAFAIAAFAGCGFEVELLNMPVHSLQPDGVFPEILKAFSIEGTFQNIDLQSGLQKWSFKKSGSLKAISWDLKDQPDLFPVLAVLCSQSEGKSILFGAPHLKAKESDRIQKTSQLLTAMNIVHQTRPDGIEIDGQPLGLQSSQKSTTDFEFSPDQDHRMAMAAALAKAFGYKIKILNPEVVQKSFPQFWQLTGVQP